MSFDVLIIGDTILENSEQFLLSILPSSLPNHVIFGTTKQATVTIRDDDGNLHYTHLFILLRYVL